jgi:hypothetical protein
VSFDSAVAPCAEWVTGISAEWITDTFAETLTGICAERLSGICAESKPSELFRTDVD